MSASMVEGSLGLDFPARAYSRKSSTHRFVLALHERVPKAMDHHSSGCLSAEKFSTFASGRQARGATTLLGFGREFHLTRLRDVPREESVAYGDGSGRQARWVRP
jgi:hypothetical protein